MKTWGKERSTKRINRGHFRSCCHMVAFKMSSGTKCLSMGSHASLPWRGRICHCSGSPGPSVYTSWCRKTAQTWSQQHCCTLWGGWKTWHRSFLTGKWLTRDTHSAWGGLSAHGLLKLEAAVISASPERIQPRERDAGPLPAKFTACKDAFRPRNLTTPLPVGSKTSQTSPLLSVEHRHTWGSSPGDSVSIWVSFHLFEFICDIINQKFHKAEINPHVCGQLIFDEGAKNTRCRKNSLFKQVIQEKLDIHM